MGTDIVAFSWSDAVQLWAVTWPEVTWTEVMSVTWPEVTPVTCLVLKHALTLVNERQNNVTSCTNCPYLILFIPFDVDKFGAVCFLLFFNFLSAERFLFKYALLVWNLTNIFFEYRKYFIRRRWLPVTWHHRRPRHFPIMHHYTS
jgi:hypothetical protein